MASITPGQKRQEAWAGAWERPGYVPPWMKRGISPQLVRAVRSGRCRPPGKVLDIGCGLGDVAAWFAAQGFQATGLDFAPAAIRRARARHGATSTADYGVIDVVHQPIPGGPYDLLVDRGCLHGIRGRDRSAYVANIAAVTRPGALFFLYVRAFRGKFPGSAQEEERALKGRLRALFRGTFNILRWQCCDIGAGVDRSPGQPLPGIFMLLQRSPVPAIPAE